jgi:hypothetical protein
MISQWFKLKPKAIALRKKGHSIRDIETELGIPRSTLSGWLKYIKLTKAQQKALKVRWNKTLIKSREKSIVWHHEQKRLRLEKAEEEADATLAELDLNGVYTQELALAILYLGEGSKKNSTTSIGNSDPLILKFFLKMMIDIYGLDVKKIRFDLHLRHDQDPIEAKKFWSKELGVPMERFKKPSIDSRTKDRKTYSTYHGVCVIDCSNVAIQRKLVYLSRKFCEKVINTKRA